MNHRWRTALFILTTAMLRNAPAGAQVAEPAQVPAPAPAPSTVPAGRILSKDPEYLKLLNPPQGNDFLRTYSKGYRDAMGEIEAKVSSISDENARSQARNDEWASVLKTDGDKFRYEAEVAFREAKISFSQSHKDGWFDAGRVSYEEYNSVLVVTPSPTDPIAANFRLAMKVATLNQAYEKFHQIAAQEIDRRAQEYVTKATPGSTCASNPQLCLNFARQDIEQSLRVQRIVVVGQGDLEAGRIDRLLLVDYDTETVLLDLDAPKPALLTAAWRFSVGPPPKEPEEPAASPENAGSVKSEHPSESGQDAAASPNQPAEESAKANVTPASIVSKTSPEYPEKARAEHIQGEVVLRATIDKEGKVSDAQVLSGDDVLAQAAVEAVRQWRYKPMLVDGEPKETRTTITVTFSLKD
jgi:TonB family protein